MVVAVYLGGLLGVRLLQGVVEGEERGGGVAPKVVVGRPGGAHQVRLPGHPGAGAGAGAGAGEGGGGGAGGGVAPWVSCGGGVVEGVIPEAGLRLLVQQDRLLGGKKPEILFPSLRILQDHPVFIV